MLAIAFGYDPDGKQPPITPPDQPSHLLGFTPVDLLASYTPPVLPTGSTPTSWSYNLDRQVDFITRPGGGTIAYGYDSAGRLHTTTLMRALDLIDATVGRSSTLAVSGILRVAAGLSALAPLYRDRLSFELEQQAHELAKRLPESDPCVRRSLSQLGCSLSVWGRHEEAAAMLEHCIQLSDTHGSNPKALVFHLNDLALILMQLNRYDEALPLLQRARTVISDPEATLHRASTTLLGGVFVKLGRFPEALEILEPIQRRRIARFGEAPNDEMTEWFNEARRAIDRPPGKKPTSRTKRPKKQR